MKEPHLQLLPIHERLEENAHFATNPLCRETLYQCIEFYKHVGFQPPWICFYVQNDGVLVGSAAYKGAPKQNRVEIAYGVFEAYQNKGFGTAICRLLTETALNGNPAVQVTARTLPEANFSTSILQRNGFACTGTVNDPEDGPVWEWVFEKEA